MPVAKADTSRSMSFSETLQAVSQEYNICIVTEAYAGEDVIIPESLWKGRSASEAIRAVATSRERDVFVIGGIYVLRHKRWAAIVVDSSRSDYPLQWSDNGIIKISRLDKLTSDEYVLPALKVNIEAKGVASSRFASELRNLASWDVRVTPEISKRRLNIYASDASPSSVLGCVAFLLNAGPEIVLCSSKDQQAMEEDASLILPDAFKKRVKPSKKLRAELEKLLTQEQQQSLANGGYIALSIHSLPEGLRKSALDYIKLSASLNSGIVPALDLSRQDSFQIRFLPAQSGSLSYILGVVTADVNGNEYVF